MKTHKILFVDDDPNVLEGLRRSLRNDFTFDTAVSGADALALIEKSGPYAVVVADMRMPVMDGLELLERVRRIAPDTVRVMLTGNADQPTAVEAVNRGQVFRFLNKPCGPETLVPALTASLQHHEVARVERELIEGTLAGTVKVLTDVLGLVAPEALGRGQRLRDLTRHLTQALKVNSTWEIEIAALLSQIGYASVPPSVLSKIANVEELSFSEQKILRRVPQIGHDLLIDIPRMREVARIVRFQHQHFDGSGVPGTECAGSAIPLGARLLKVLLDRLQLEFEGVVKRAAHDTMKERLGRYDPPLLELSFACFPNFLDTAVTADQAVLSLSLAELQVGHIVVSEIATPEGVPLIGAGTRLTEMMLERLRNHAELGEVTEPIFVQDPVVAAAPVAGL